MLRKLSADEIRGRWNTVEGIAIFQRIGRLQAGTPTVFIACSAPHRDADVFYTDRDGIERLKAIVPVWKKKFGPAVNEWVEGSYIPKARE